MKKIGERKRKNSDLNMFQLAQASMIPHLKKYDRRMFFKQLEFSLKNKDNKEDLTPEEKNKAVEKLKGLKGFFKK